MNNKQWMLVLFVLLMLNVVAGVFISMSPQAGDCVTDDIHTGKFIMRRPHRLTVVHWDGFAHNTVIKSYKLKACNDPP